MFIFPFFQPSCRLLKLNWLLLSMGRAAVGWKKNRVRFSLSFSGGERETSVLSGWLPLASGPSSISATQTQPPTAPPVLHSASLTHSCLRRSNTFTGNELMTSLFILAPPFYRKGKLYSCFLSAGGGIDFHKLDVPKPKISKSPPERAARSSAWSFCW